MGVSGEGIKTIHELHEIHETGRLSSEIAMFNHQTAILDNLYSCLGQFFSDSIVADSGLHPDCLRLLRQNVVQMGRHIF